MILLASIEAGAAEAIRSPVQEEEINQNPDAEKRSGVRAFLKLFQVRCPMDDRIYERAEELIAVGFKEFDALHLACAEAARADMFLTMDDRLIACVVRNPEVGLLPVSNPADLMLRGAFES